MRILYAAGNREGSYHQLKRYLPLFEASNHQFKIAGYKKSIKELNADYCLDALLNFTNENGCVSFNGNFSYYGKEISKFNPNLIISDFEIYTSIYAIDKGIPLWQISPALLYYGINDQLKRNIGIHKYNSNLISGDRARHQYIKNILNNSEKKMVVSHLCDIDEAPELIDGFEWCRPEFKLKQVNTMNTSSGIGVELADSFYNEWNVPLKLPSRPDIEMVSGMACNSYFKLNIKINDSVKFLMEVIK